MQHIDNRNSTSNLSTRAVYIDNLRTCLVLGLIPFHTARLFDHETWHIKNAQDYLAADILIGVFNLIGMPALFLLAGFGAVRSLQNRSGARFVSERAKRLLVPLVTGIVLFVLPQVYVERHAPLMPLTMSSPRSDSPPLQFMGEFFHCCYPQANFSYHHLWFLLYLFVYSVVALPVLSRIALQTPDRSSQALWSRPRLLALVALLALPLMAGEVILRPLFPSTHALIDDWANHVHFLYLILLGALLAVHRGVGAALRRNAATVVMVALLLLGLCLSNAFASPVLSGRSWLALRIFTESWFVAASLASFMRWGNRTLPFITAFAPKAMVLYIAHQAIIVVLGSLTIGWESMPLLKFGVIAAATAILSILLAEFVSRFTLLRVLFGLPALPGRPAGSVANPSSPQQAA